MCLSTPKATYTHTDNSQNKRKNEIILKLGKKNEIENQISTKTATNHLSYSERNGNGCNESIHNNSNA